MLRLQTRSIHRARMLAACLLIGCAWATASPGQSAGVCARTTKEGEKACTSAANANYALAVGTCANLTDRAAKAKCMAKAQQGLTRDQKFCTAEANHRNQICTEVGAGAYDPVIDPADFGYPITNQWFPLIPGTTFTYSVPDGLDIVKVTGKTVNILGVNCVVVEDIVKQNGVQTENTLDYYTQDKYGNVWYFGEDSQTLTNGRVTDTTGSWRAGVNGAKAGIIMETDPTRGDAYRQEFSLGVAEDVAEVISFNNKVTVPYGTFKDTMMTLETEGLEPKAKEHKYYAPGVGNVLVIDLVTGEHDELISVVKK